MSNLIKRSLRLNGHPTSVALEPEFWSALADMADKSNRTVPQLIQEIDTHRSTGNLSSALRLAVLRHFRDNSTAQQG